MSTNEIADAIGVDRRLVRRWMLTARHKGAVQVTLLPGHGRLKYVEPLPFAAWMEKAGFVESAAKLRNVISTA